MNEIAISKPHPIIGYITPFIHTWIEDLERIEGPWGLVGHLRGIRDDIDFVILYNRDRIFKDTPVWIIDVLKTIKNTISIFINTMFPTSAGASRNTLMISTNKVLKKNVTKRTINLLRKSLNELESGSINENTQPITLKELL